MGQAWSYNKNSCAVLLDQPTALSGEALSGVVVLNVVEAFDCSVVQLKVEGSEVTYWDEKEEERYQDDNGDWKENIKTTPRSGREDFIKVSYPIYTCGQHCEPGQYQFPFRISLPAGLPATFTYRDACSPQGIYTYQNLTADVEYKLVAECLKGGSSHATLSHSQALVVRQRPQRAPGSLTAEKQCSISACCCLGGGGSVLIRATLEKEAYAPGESVKVSLEVDNKAEVDFSSTELRVTRNIELVASAGLYRNSDDDVVHATSGGVPRGAALMGDKALKLVVQLPGELQPTTAGRTITSEYKVVVKLHAGTFTSEAKLSLPLTVLAPPVGAAGAVLVGGQAPPEWKPTVVGTPVEVPLAGLGPMPPKQEGPMVPPSAPNPTYAGPQ